MNKDNFHPPIYQYLLIFFCTFLFLFVFSATAPLVPRRLIKSHMNESAEYMVEQGAFPMILDFVKASLLDYYADSVTLSIAYSLDENHPVTSSMWSDYYGVSSNMMPEYLKELVESDLEPNIEYMRYWHGSASLMRIMHVLFNVKNVYFINYLLMLCLLTLLLIVLWRNDLKAEAVCFAISMISVSIWYVPLCLEYTFTVLIMIAVSIACVIITLKNEDPQIGIIFLINGMVTVYFDFLTAEILTLFIPLLLVLRIRSKQSIRSIRTEISFLIEAGALWSIGYVGMWVMKWIMASILLHQNMLPFITGHITERLNGDVVPGTKPNHYIITAIIKNIKCLFPYEFGISGGILVLAFILMLFVLVFLDRIKMKKVINKGMIRIYAVLAVAPFIRFSILHNHAYRHYFFTYRALAVTVLSLCFMMLELLEFVPRKVVKTNA